MTDTDEFEPARRYMVTTLGMSEAEAAETVRLCTSDDPDTIEEMAAGIADLLDKLPRDPRNLLTDEERQEMNDDLARLAHIRRTVIPGDTPMGRAGGSTMKGDG